VTVRAAALRRLWTLLTACALALVAAGCGNSSELIPASDASKLDTALQRVAEATDAGDCERATAALKEAQDAFAALPSEVSSRLTTRLSAGLKQLSDTVPTQCQAGGITPADSGPTGPETTTTTTTTAPPPADSGPTGPTTPEVPTDTTPQEPDSGGIAPENGNGPDGNGPPGKQKKDKKEPDAG
jgi:hypothetical protein